MMLNIAVVVLLSLLPIALGEHNVCDGTLRCSLTDSTTNIFIPHPTDCTKSYRCKEGKPVVYTCPEGELFSVEEQKCMDATEVICTRRCIEPPAVTTEVAETTDGVCDGTIRCPSTDSDTSSNFIRHPTDCAKSYKCKNGKPMIYTCPDGELFSQDEQKCVDATKVICTRRCIEPPEVTTETTEVTTADVCDGTIRCPSTDSDASSNFIRHPTDCAKSYKCKNGKPMIYTCPDGEFFSQDEQKCVDATKVICTKRCIEPPEVTTEVTETTEETTDDVCDGTIRCPATDSDTSSNFIRHPTDCAKSYKCKNGKPMIYTCPDGELFSQDEQKCVDATKVICTRRCIEPPEVTTEVTETAEVTTDDVCDGTISCPSTDSDTSSNFIRHPTDCAKSYKCKNGKPMIYTCPDGELFSQDEQKCVDAKKVICTKRCIEPPTVTTEVTQTTEVITEVTQTTEVTTEVTETTEVTTDISSESSNSSESSESSESESHEIYGCDSNQCPSTNGKNPVYLPHDDCTKFCVCDWGTAYVFNCPLPLNFNTKLNVCDWPTSAGCQSL